MIVAICGAKRCGKDTVALYLQKALVARATNVVHHYKIAQPLKDICKIMFGWSTRQVEEDEKDMIDDKWGITPRDAMKFMGTEVMQYKIQELLPGIKRNFWIKQLSSRIQKKATGDHVIISDMRFMHEYTMLKQHFPDAVVIKVTRGSGNGSSGSNDTHSSETEWKSIPHDLLIENDGSIDELHAQLDEFLTS